MSNRLINAIAWVVMSCWVVSFALDATIKTYEPPPQIGPAMLIVVGAAFTASTLRKAGGNSD